MRSGLDTAASRDPAVLAAGIKRYATSEDPHERAANFVIGVFTAFRDAYQDAIADLLRIATGGTGVLPPGRLHPDLVERVTTEAIGLADKYLGMVIRAFDYMPVVDPTFGDLVRSIVTADHDLYPDDAIRLRGRLVECLRHRGIYPPVDALSDEAMIWPAPPRPLSLATQNAWFVQEVLASSTADLDLASSAGTVAAGDADTDGAVAPPAGQPASREEPVKGQLVAWAQQHAHELGLDPEYAESIRLRGVHASYRTAADRQPRPEIVVQFSQNRPDLAIPLDSDRSLEVRAGTTVVAHTDGRVRFVVSKPLPSATPRKSETSAGAQRLATIAAWVTKLNANDQTSVWISGEPAVLRSTFAHLHQEPS